MKKMNILILFTQPWKTGGAETHVEALLKGLCTHKVFLAVNHGSDESKLAKLKEKYNNDSSKRSEFSQVEEKL